MNYTESFEQFASRVTPTDLALYAGAGIILWILFKDKLSPVQKFLGDLVGGLKSKLNNGSSVVPVVVPDVAPVAVTKETKEDNFFKLVVSWKQTRDLAVKSGCDEAVKVADQMFPFLSPTVCSKEKTV
jgi:hypothetical protein